MTESNELLIDDIKTQIYELYSDIKASLDNQKKKN